MPTVPLGRHYHNGGFIHLWKQVDGKFTPGKDRITIANKNKCCRDGFTVLLSQMISLGLFTISNKLHAIV